MPHFRSRYAAFKRLVEAVLAAALLVLTAPLIAATCLLTRLTSPGPAIFRQVRLGRDGKTFTIWKLRTMRVDSEAMSGAVWASSDDVRVTRIGQFLRETHIDELPQLWNVIRGDMSLIGPRPERPEIAARLEKEVPFYHDRLRVRPGITGLAQVERPADRDLRDVHWKLAYDLYYQQHLSPWLDLRIALCTVFYLTGLALSCSGKLLVKSYRRAVESGRDGGQILQLVRKARGPADTV
jgi:lipopolysaccharide/colanic/teichoic acid biosynthesis glycosyltransferase